MAKSSKIVILTPHTVGLFFVVMSKALKKVMQCVKNCSIIQKNYVIM